MVSGESPFFNSVLKLFPTNIILFDSSEPYADAEIKTDACIGCKMQPVAYRVIEKNYIC